MGAIMDLRTSWHLLKTAAGQWSADHASEKGAALAYYTLFSIAPLLVIAITIAGLVFGEEAARGAVAAQLTDALGKDAAGAVQDLLAQVNEPGAGTFATVASIVTLLLGALGSFLHLRSALSRIWRLSPPGGGGILAIVLDYAIAVLLVLLTGGLLLVSVIASAVLTYLGQRFEGHIPGGHLPWRILEFVVSVAFLTLVFAVIFRVCSANRIAWGLVWFGAALTSLLFTIGKTLIGLYLGSTGTASAYGAAGSLVLFLIWVYYSAQILFFGAELIQARRQQEASRAA
jgi:membrane protein